MDITDRARLLLGIANLEELAKPNSKEYVRWQNVKRGRARFGAVEIEELGKLFPNWAFWLTTGKVAPEIGQTSPAYDEANRKLHNQNVG
ncbi:MAG: DNA-binding protein [Gammaproteobacteria bacterium]|nr:DNA-binding protein [Gammaproteobacteria bacterium]